jgi:hypothetical protein
MYAGRPFRGIALGGLELYGWLQVASGATWGTLCIVGAIVADVIGAMIVVRTRPALPVAQTHRIGSSGSP